MPTSHSIHITSLGCAKNSVDTEALVRTLENNGFSITPAPEDADLFLVNTCCFIEKATQESVDTILQLCDDMDKPVIVCGCLPQRYGDQLADELPEASALLGVNDLDHLIPACRAALEGRRYIHPQCVQNEIAPALGMRVAPGHYAFVKIADGCDNRCSYCVIPDIRGPFRSREIGDIVNEVKALVDQGVGEVNLIAQDTTSFGRGTDEGLEALTERLLGIDRLGWIRLLYCYPGRISDGLLRLMAAEPRVLSYLDIPLQHINDDVLVTMRRHYNRGEAEKTLARARELVPDLVLRTTFIVGFPGETEGNFEELLDFIKKWRFERVGAFAYSRETGTPAAEMAVQISGEVAEERLARLMELQQGISLEINEGLVGERLSVLVDGPSEETDLLLQGRSYREAPDVDGLIYINDGSAERGAFAEVEITEAHEYDLVGHIVGSQ